ncbi:MAG: CPBP family intramembrane metalloprotease [Dysgonamonadaceae bacterium]|nr:CPBP family intramembrane metalloprotease [Dysgonamonadaceae bacterium]
MDTGIGACIVKELIFRGLIMRSMEWTFGKKTAVLISSVLFTLLHIVSFGTEWIVFLIFLMKTIQLFLSLIHWR